MAPMAIDVVNRQRFCPIDKDGVARIAAATLAEVGRPGASLTVAFIRDRAIRKLNRTYRGNNHATDVLSFPTSKGRRDASIDPKTDLILDADHLGDVLIAADTACRQASEAGHSLEREFSELVIHGALHLCGYDHETDNGEMNRLELRLRHKLLRKAK